MDRDKMAKLIQQGRQAMEVRLRRDQELRELVGQARQVLDTGLRELDSALQTSLASRTVDAPEDTFLNQKSDIFMLWDNQLGRNLAAVGYDLRIVLKGDGVTQQGFQYRRHASNEEAERGHKSKWRAFETPDQLAVFLLEDLLANTDHPDRKLAVLSPSFFASSV